MRLGCATQTACCPEGRAAHLPRAAVPPEVGGQSRSGCWRGGSAPEAAVPLPPGASAALPCRPRGSRPCRACIGPPVIQIATRTRRAWEACSNPFIAAFPQLRSRQCEGFPAAQANLGRVAGGEWRGRPVSRAPGATPAQPGPAPVQEAHRHQDGMWWRAWAAPARPVQGSHGDGANSNVPYSCYQRSLATLNREILFWHGRAHTAGTALQRGSRCPAGGRPRCA